MVEKRVVIVEGVNSEARDLAEVLNRLGYTVADVVRGGGDVAERLRDIESDVMVADAQFNDGARAYEVLGDWCAREGMPAVYVFDEKSQNRPVPEDMGVCYTLYVPFGDQELQHGIEAAVYRMRSAKQLEESEARFRLFYENSPVAYQSLDAEGRILEVNPAWLEMLGYERSEVLGRSIKEFLMESSSEGFDGMFKDFKESGKLRGHSVCMVCSDGRKRFIEADGNICHDENGRFVQTHCVMRDVTEARVAEEEKERCLKLLEQKNKELEQIIHIASHDLRSPLVTIRGFGMELADACERIGELLKDVELGQEKEKDLQELLGAEVPESLKFISAGTDKMDSLISSLLRLARIGTAALDIQPLDMNMLVTNIKHSMEFQIQEKEVDVIVEEGLPGCMGDPTQISQVFSNLMGNAVKYLDGSRKGVIRVSGERKGDWSEYCVEDNGGGIEQDQLDRIFEMFYRLDPDGSEGEGLGLTIVRRIVSGHEGRIWVDSEVGKGSKFFVALPAAD
ncbi:Phytochrome-like protein cph1 [Anaerohalosphaera lusitana]|uniref:histidine kinase n=1 Tax=Anaerohalosphaera lusitana TaxID=1936003 RepID=A0A1U9NPS1_9BACT|nr:ATP-binding protein [Anaerohalosphaera lusitana]AQT69913.1 Phytochrome-like protein cph1 [Anaerohalosphaera lusitana]